MFYKWVDSIAFCICAAYVFQLKQNKSQTKQNKKNIQRKWGRLAVKEQNTTHNIYETNKLSEIFMNIIRAKESFELFSVENLSDNAIYTMSKWFFLKYSIIVESLKEI